MVGRSDGPRVERNGVCPRPREATKTDGWRAKHDKEAGNVGPVFLYEAPQWPCMDWIVSSDLATLWPSQYATVEDAPRKPYGSPYHIAVVIVGHGAGSL